jgi:hypothetical protein
MAACSQLPLFDQAVHVALILLFDPKLEIFDPE